MIVMPNLVIGPKQCDLSFKVNVPDLFLIPNWFAHVHV